MIKRVFPVLMIGFSLMILSSWTLFSEELVVSESVSEIPKNDATSGWTVTGESLYRADVGGWSDVGTGSFNGGESIIQPSVSFNSRYIGFIATPRLIVASNDATSMSLSELSLSLANDSPYSVRIGKVAQDIGSARLFRNGSFLGESVTPARLINGPLVSSRPEYLIAGTCELRFVRISATLAPFSPVASTVSGESALFPGKDIQDPYEYSVFFPVSKALSEVQWVTDDDNGRFSIDPSFLFEAEVSDTNYSIGISAFHGMDRQSTVVGKVVSLELTDPEHYILQLYSHKVAIQGIGLFGSLAGKQSRVWFDASFVDGRLLPVGSPYDMQGTWQKARLTRSLALTTGISADFAEGRVVVGAEWRNSFYFFDTEDINYSFLHRALYGFVTSSFAGGKVGTAINCVYSLSDGSMFLSPSLCVSAIKNHDVSLGCAIPFGATTSELGQFSSTQAFFVTLSLSVK